jgi:hypothetical protein
MPEHNRTWFQSKTRLRLLVTSCLSLSLAFFLSLSSTSIAHAANPPASGMHLQVDIGFNSYYRIGYWTPIHITISNQGPDFSGRLVINTVSGQSLPGSMASTSPWSFEEPVTLARGTQKQIALTVPLYMGLFSPHGVLVKLLDQHSNLVAMQEQMPEYLGPSDFLVGIFSDYSAGFDPLSTVTLPNRYSSIVLVPLDASTMPTTTTVLANFDVIVLDDFATRTLSSAQLSTLQTWVNQGGALIEIGGSAWQRTLGPLPPALLPVELNGTSLLPAGVHLLPSNSSPTDRGTSSQPRVIDTLQEAIVASTATPRTPDQDVSFDSETILSSGSIPLLVQARHGQGVICYLAFDPALPPFANWSSIDIFWKQLLIRALGDHALLGVSPQFSSGPGEILARGGLVQILQPTSFLSPWVIGFLLLGYLLIIGPVRLLIVRRLKRPQWGWRIVMSGILVFSLLALLLSFYQHGAALLDNSISIVQINADGSPAHITTYHGIFDPNETNFELRLPANDLALPISDFIQPGSPVFSEDDLPSTITPTSNTENVDLPNAGIWPFHALVSEQDRRLFGGISANVALQNNRLVGSITNTLDVSLNDVYLLMPHNFVVIGTLAPGRTQKVDLPLQKVPVTSGLTLADAIAMNNGLPASYYPYDQNQRPTNDFQRHLAILSALSGVGVATGPCGAPCITHDIVSKGSIITTPPGTPLNINLPQDNDPLLLNNAPATLIGWADAPLDGINNITINGSTLNGFHDNLVQVPVNIDLASSSTIPPGLIAGHIIDEQNSDAEDTAPDTYTLSTGSVTFEFNLPGTQQENISSLTLTEPNAIGNVSLPPTTGPHSDLIQAQLYNWQTMSWDNIVLNSWTFTTTNTAAYLGPGGRVLLQIANQDPSGLLVFMKPSLSL